MAEFIGRSEELKRLNDLYASKRSAACIIYGRHKIGKTAILKKFCEDKRHLYLTCAGGTVRRTMDSFTSVIEDVYPDHPPINCFEDLLNCLSKLKSNRTVVVIDDFQEMTALDQNATVSLREFINKTMHRLNIILAVCSADIKGISDGLDDRNSPLYGAFASEIRVNPMPFADTKGFHVNMDEPDRIRMYCIAGGVPYYHLLLNEDNARNNIVEHILGPVSPFVSAVLNDVNELTPNQSSSGIMTVLSDGAASLKEISDETGFTGAAVMKAMEPMVLSGIIRKERPIGGKRDPMYRITDGPLLFYYRIMHPNRSLISDEDVELSYMMLEEEMEMSYKTMFEEICKQYILKNFYCLEIGRWWEKNPEGGQKDSVDIIARVLLGKEESTLLCECGFFDRPTGMNDLMKLTDSREKIRDIGNTRYVMFSRSGFDDELKEYAEMYPTERIELVGIELL